MPNIFKHFLKPEAAAYVFQPASELVVDDQKRPAETEPPVEAAVPEELNAEEVYEPAPDETPEQAAISFAKIQADAIMRQAREDAERYREEAMKELDAELEEQRRAAREEGYSQGYTQGMSEAMAEAKIHRDQMAADQIQAVEAFLEAAARKRDQILDDNRAELKDLALAIAEKVIQVSLKNSSDILLRMVEAATDTHKRCEWAHIYVADCDLKGKAYTIPELTAALGNISDRVRVIPMADDESGTCIVELPDVIMDASVSTQLGNIREILENTGED